MSRKGRVNRAKWPHTCVMCGREFMAIQRVKKYCSMKCYTSSPETLERLRALNERAKNQVTRQCSRCGAAITRKRSCCISTRWSFCNKVCYREFLVARFDSFILTPKPEDLDLIQNFDEFFSQHEIRCPVPGCGWFGLRLGMHARIVHGYEATSLKDAMGCNAHTGLVSATEHLALSARAIGLGVGDNLVPGEAGRSFGISGHHPSREAKEHSAKARALLGPEAFSRPMGSATRNKIAARLRESWAQRIPKPTLCDCGATFGSKHPRQKKCPSCRKRRRSRDGAAREVLEKTP